ncbi:MAG: hypothetical protein L3J29_07995 [Cyclobacteriaceae bacterium]|nr:hypothetical protein [Cyclobacteriaceae bacterium]
MRKNSNGILFCFYNSIQRIALPHLIAVAFANDYEGTLIRFILTIIIDKKNSVFFAIEEVKIQIQIKKLSLQFLSANSFSPIQFSQVIKEGKTLPNTVIIPEKSIYGT